MAVAGPAFAQTVITTSGNLPSNSAGVKITNGATVTGNNATVAQSPDNIAVDVVDGDLTLNGGTVSQSRDLGSSIGVIVRDGSAKLDGTTIDVRGGTDSSGINVLGANTTIVATGVTINTDTTGSTAPSPTAGVKADSGSISISNSVIASTGTRGYGLLAASNNGAQASIVSNGNTITTNGERAFGAYAFADSSAPAGNGTIQISGGSISTQGLNAWGLLAFGDKAVIETSNGLSVSTEGENAFGAYVTGTLNLRDTSISTSGSGAYGLNVQSNGNVTVNGGSVNSVDSAGVAVFGSANVSLVGTTVSAGQQTFLSTFTGAGQTQAIMLGDKSVATQNDGRLLSVTRDNAGADGNLTLTLGAGSTSTGDILDLDTRANGGGTDVTVEQGASWSGSLQGIRNFTSFAGGNVSYDGRAQIEGDLTGRGTSYTFSSEGADIGGDVSLQQGSRTTGGSVGSRISVGGNVDVDQTSTMGGNWAIAGNLTDAGTIAPGNSIGRVSVGGNLTLVPTSVYAVEIDGTGNADRVDVAGTANLAGTVTVTPLGGFLIGQPYTILTAGTRNGVFDSTRFTQAQAFLSPRLDYTPNTVFLTIQRNGVPFASAGQTANQIATANALDSLPMTNSLAAAVALSTASNATAAFDQLSGEVHASVRSALVDGSRHVRDAVSSRLEDAFGVVAQGADIPLSEERFLSSGAWVSGFGSWGEADGTGNSAEAERNSRGIFVGGDVAVSSNATIGLFGGYSNTSIDVNARNSSADVDSIHIGGYGAAAFGALELSAGAAYTWNDVDTSRGVVFPGFADTLTANYDSDVAQVFSEVGYRLDLGGVALKPFAGLAYVHLDGDSFTESGGAASLTSSGGSSDTTFTTLGVRASRDIRIGSVDVSARGMIGWRYAGGDQTPTSTNSFGAGIPFTVSGAPISRNAAVIEAGFSTEIAPNMSLSLDYVGLLGEDSTDNGVKASLGIRF